MLYYVCPTCRTKLADKQIPYELSIEKIINEKISKEKKDEKVGLLLDELQLVNYCCRMLMLSYFNAIDKIN
jgi:DNA-directed RNA polymerase subunit N (RpoN/RPB10)